MNKSKIIDAETRLVVTTGVGVRAVNQTFSGEHYVEYTNIKLYCCIQEIIYMYI